MEFTLNTESYNSRRYGRPWIATVEFSNDPTGEFDFGIWTGDHHKGGAGVLTITAYPGDIIAEGQKDHRKPRNTERNYYVLLTSGKLNYLGDKADAYKYYLAKKEEVKKPNAMKRAWEIRREAATKFNCKVTEISMSECLKLAWAEIKNTVKIAA